MKRNPIFKTAAVDFVELKPNAKGRLEAVFDIGKDGWLGSVHHSPNNLRNMLGRAEREIAAKVAAKRSVPLRLEKARQVLSAAMSQFSAPTGAA